MPPTFSVITQERWGKRKGEFSCVQKGKRKVTVMQRKEDYKFSKMTNLQLHENAFKLRFPQASLKNHTETIFLKS